MNEALQGTIESPDLSFPRSGPLNSPSRPTDERRAAAELRARIEVWINEGGAGSEASQ
jgi:hypothetical protein